jgi:hypothetical protein
MSTITTPMRDTQLMGRVFNRFAALVSACVLACAALSSASATLLLEEPYGKLGFFTATGHAAVYLSGVCAETPVVLRPCAPGETGVVISRYDGVNGYDWVAIPLISYLYAVDRPEDVPLFADAKMVSFLRDRYRRRYLEDIAPDVKNGETPGGNWYELVGSSYDRTIYGFEIETTPKQDEVLIRKLNSSPNVSHFHLVSRNCADFAKDVLNLYFPKTLHRSIVADAGITTPKQMAKLLSRYGDRHPELRLSRLVISQVPGSMARSTTAHGVVESFMKSKKYIVPSAVFSPIFAGCVAAVYVGTGAGHFDPSRNAMVFVVGSQPEAPLGREDRRAYQLELKHYLAGAYPETPGKNVDHSWERLQSHARTEVDSEGRPMLEMQIAGNPVEIGASADNILNGNPPPQLVRQLIEARLRSELRSKESRVVSESEIARDWTLLQQTIDDDDPHATARPALRAESTRGNRP